MFFRVTRVTKLYVYLISRDRVWKWIFLFSMLNAFTLIINFQNVFHLSPIKLFTTKRYLKSIPENSLAAEYEGDRRD